MPADAFWHKSADDLVRELETRPEGLPSQEAALRLERYGRNRPRPSVKTAAITLFLRQFRNPIILLLLAAAALSLLLGELTDALLIYIIVLASSALQFWQEHSAARSLEKLLALIHTRATVLRNGRPLDVPVEEVVPGDVALLNAGDSVPGDCLVLEAEHLMVDEATLTGETYPVDKLPGVLPPDTPLLQRTNSLFMGTHIASGSARAVVVRTGRATEFGKIARRLEVRPPETAFQQGVRRFGALLLEITLVLTLIIFAINTYLARPVLESMLFALALAVGLTPQLLPAIVSITLSQGARRMATKKVVVRQLEAIENLGSMDVLCSDKTGTLTEGRVRVRSATGLDGVESEKVARAAYLNAALQGGYTNPIDDALKERYAFDLAGVRKLDEVPYDFGRKRLSVLVESEGAVRLVTKGAVQSVSGASRWAETAIGQVVDINAVRPLVLRMQEDLGSQGFRVLAVAFRDMNGASRATREDERDLTFLGFIVLHDPPKAGIVETLAGLRGLGVTLKVVTGDYHIVASRLAETIGLDGSKVLTGGEIAHMSDRALLRQADGVSVFAEVEPAMKERIIRVLRRSGHVVGYLGDGINDAAALHAADVGISVEGATDVAKEAAQFVLLEKSLDVLAEGVREGRQTFANTLKYVMITASANFGNMASMAVLSFFVPFLPMLPKQILLNNLLTDLPAIAIAGDRVDPELVARPRRWDVGFIRDFMIAFGVQSSIFDALTFGALLLWLQAVPVLFRTGWFLESAISEVLILLVIRTRRPFLRSRPGRSLEAASWIVILAALLLPYSSLAGPLGFAPLPLPFLLVLGVILAGYVAAAEMTKSLFYTFRSNRRSAGDLRTSPRFGWR